MTHEKRTYQMKKRAESQERTRERIIESTVELHETLGIARTTISAVAEHAGVRRSTVYRHFTDEAALIVACASHWQAANQPPDPGAWAAIEDIDQRLQTALSDLYAFYRTTGQVLDNVFRDEANVPIITQLLSGFRGYMAAVQELLMNGRSTRGATGRRTTVVVGHALSFTTWRSLTHDNHLTDNEAAHLMYLFVTTLSDHTTLGAAKTAGDRS